MIFLSILILIVAIALPSINNPPPKVHSNIYIRISSIILLYSGLLALNAINIPALGSGIGLFSGLFHVTLLSQTMDCFIFLIGAFILVAWPLLKVTNKYALEYSVLILFSTLGASLLISSSDIVSMYLSIELQSFGVYIIATIFRDSDKATLAGLKYFLLGALSSCIILLGGGLVYSYTGLTNFESIYSLISVLAAKPLQGINLGCILICVGLLFKIAAAPLHNWAPDVYDDSPTIITIWLTIMPKLSILMLFLELYIHIHMSEINLLILISSIISLLLGTIVGLAQTRIKRLLAYSTISHVGFILLALAMSNESSIESFLFYIIQYSITNLNTFLILIAFAYLIYNTKDINFISDLKGQLYLNPLMSLSFSICLFSMAGIPPLIGFFSKQFVLYSAIQSGYYYISIIAILVSVISASYYLKIIKVLLDIPSINMNTINKSLTNYHCFLISNLTLLILCFVLKPSILLNSTRLLSLSIFTY